MYHSPEDDAAEFAIRAVLRRAVREQQTDLDRSLAQQVERQRQNAFAGSTIDDQSAIERLASLWVVGMRTRWKATQSIAGR